MGFLSGVPMFKFFIKKNFADGWDNFFFLILTNAIQIILLSGSYFALKFSGSIHPLLPDLVLLPCSALLMTSIFAWGANAAKIADFRAGTFSVYFSAIKSVWKIACLSGVFFGIAFLFIRFAFSYYISLYFTKGSILGLLITAALGWFLFVCLVALQWFVPLYYLQESNGFVKCLKKSFIIFYDNVFFSIGVFFYNLLLAILSCIAFLLIPGINGLLLSSTNALRLRLYKYDWIEKMNEENPGFENDRDKRNEVPWDELLAEDKESLGPRKLSSFIFPWK